MESMKQFGQRIPFWLQALSSLLRRLPIRGRIRAIRLLTRLLPANRPYQLSTSDGIRVTVPSLREPISLEVLAYGRHEDSIDDLIRSHLPSGGTFVDVGANLGLFTARMSKFVGPSGRVIAVEASPTIFTYLLKTIADNELGNIVACNVAATDGTIAELSFWDAPLTSFGMGALAEQFGSVPIRVPAIKLDDLLFKHKIQHVDVLKVDVEGFETGVFLGAQRLLTSQNAPVIVFEALDWAERRAGLNPGQSQRTLCDFGYKLYSVDGQRIKEPVTMGGGNFLAIPPASQLK